MTSAAAGLAGFSLCRCEVQRSSAGWEIKLLDLGVFFSYNLNKKLLPKFYLGLLNTKEKKHNYTPYL